MSVLTLFLTGLSGLNGLRVRNTLSLKSMSTVSLPYSMDWGQMLPVPNVSEVFSRYCHVDSEFTTRLRHTQSGFMEYGGEEAEGPISEAELVSGHCSEDTDCGKERPYCIDEVCRECREGNESEDCPIVKGAICSEETRYTCSSCARDQNCRSGTYCRTVFDKMEALNSGKLPRNQCVACDTVPVYGEIVDAGNCRWRCPIEEYFFTSNDDDDDDDDESSGCSACPKCAVGEYYAPRSKKSSHFYSTCTNATDVVCSDCASIGIKSEDSSFCAKILSPSPRLAEQIAVGDLGEGYPCRFFECKPNWFLSLSVKKCKKCHMTMCAPGEYLAGCGGIHPGECQACKGRIPRGAEWIIGNSGEFSISKPIDTCQFTCPKNHVFEDGECVASNGEYIPHSNLYSLEEEDE